MKIPYLFVGLLALMPTLGAQAADKVYKWKDANGVVHFTDQPPPQGTEFDNVEVKGAAAITQSSSEAKKEDAAAAADPNAPADDKQAAVAANAKARCEQAQQRLTILEAKGDVNVEENGKTVRLDKDRRAAEISIAKAQVQSYCAPAKQDDY